jgi:hypothetical protein
MRNPSKEVSLFCQATLIVTAVPYEVDHQNHHQGRHPVGHEFDGQVHVAITFWLFNT